MSRANFTDRLLLIYWTVLTVAVAVQRHRVEPWVGLVVLHAVLIAVILTLARGRDRWPVAHAWYPLLLPLIAFHEAALLHNLFVDEWRDSYILAWEARLFEVPPTVWLGQFRSLSLSEMMQFGYLSYFLFLPLIGFVLYRRADKAPFFGVMAATMLAYVVCYVIFLVFPTEGPAHTLRHLHTSPIPDGPLAAVVQFTQRAGTHGNAFPSAHIAGATVSAAFAAKYAIRYAPLLFASLLLMCAGAVYDRYHYASDIVAGAIIGAVAAGIVHVMPKEILAGLSPAPPATDDASRASR